MLSLSNVQLLWTRTTEDLGDKPQQRLYLAGQNPIGAFQVLGIEVRLRPLVIGRNEPAYGDRRVLG